MLKVLSTLRAKAGCEEELLRAADKLVAATKSEPRNQAYELWRAVNDRRTVVFDEVWDSLEAWQAHIATAHLKEFKAVTADLIEWSAVTAARPRAGV